MVVGFHLRFKFRLGFVVSSICVHLYLRIILAWRISTELCFLLCWFFSLFFISFFFFFSTSYSHSFCSHIQWVEREQCAEDGLRNMFLVFLFCFVGYYIWKVEKKNKKIKLVPMQPSSTVYFCEPETTNNNNNTRKIAMIMSFLLVYARKSRIEKTWNCGKKKKLLHTHTQGKKKIQFLRICQECIKFSPSQLYRIHQIIV